MKTFPFTATSGTPAELNVAQHSAGGEVITWAIHNEGANQLTINAKLFGSTNWGLLGTVEAGEIKTMERLKGVMEFQIVGDGSGVLV